MGKSTHDLAFRRTNIPHVLSGISHRPCQDTEHELENAHHSLTPTDRDHVDPGPDVAGVLTNASKPTENKPYGICYRRMSEAYSLSGKISALRPSTPVLCQPKGPTQNTLDMCRRTRMFLRVRVSSFNTEIVCSKHRIQQCPQSLAVCPPVTQNRRDSNTMLLSKIDQVQTVTAQQHPPA